MKRRAQRITHRHSASSREAPFFKRDAHRSETFGTNSIAGFFKPAITATQANGLHRKCADCEAEEQQVQRKEEDKKEEEKISRQPERKEDEKEKLLQKKEGSSPSSSSKSVSQYVSTLSGKGEQLPAHATAFFSSRMGYDFSSVRLHTNNEAAESAGDINAKAYTVGNNIVFNQGQYNFSSNEGKKLLAHELTHVIQNNQANTGGSEVQRKISYSLPAYTKEDPIPKVLKGRGGKLGETYITINGKKPLRREDAIKTVFEAFNNNLSLNYDPAAKTCKVNTSDINIDVSAAITLLTDPVKDKWAGQYPGHVVAGSYTCSKLPSVNIEMVSTPSGGAALYKSVSDDEAQHFSDIIDVSEKHLESFYTYLESLSLPADKAGDCAAKFSAEVGSKDIIMATAFADDWLAAVNKYDNPAGSHHYRSVTDARTCNPVTITVSF